MMTDPDLEADKYEAERKRNGPRYPAIRLPARRRLVVDAEGMSADILRKHVHARHPELTYDMTAGMHVSELLEEHRVSHRLIDKVLDHYHEDGDR
jgi:hypothetical protein